MRNAGGIESFSTFIDKFIKSERGVLYTLWALIPFTFIDCGFRVVGAGSIIRSLAHEKKVAKERIAFILNNTASPLIELIPIATTFVGFNIANVGLGLKAAGVGEKHSAYDIWISVIPYEFFSIVVILITFSTLFYQWKTISSETKTDSTGPLKNSSSDMMLNMKMKDKNPEIKPRLANLVFPMLTVILLSIFLVQNFVNEPNRAMLIALFITLIITSVFFSFQKYVTTKITKYIISGGNEIMRTISILVLAWSLGSLSQQLHLSDFVQQQLGGTLPIWSLPITLFVLSSAITYFIGSGWATASLMMPFAITLAVTVGAGIPICVGAVITGGTFGDVTSPVAGMTNMASNVAGADQMKYLKYATPYNLVALVLAALLFLIFGFLG
jgi:tetracycline resistance efflux pump